MCGRLPASRTHFSRKIGAVLGIHRNCWAKLLPPSWICFLFVCSVNEVIVGRGQKPRAKRLDWSLRLSPETKSFLSASRLKCLTAAQELRFATLWCDARLLPGWRWLFLVIAREKVVWKRTRDTRSRRGEKNKKHKKTKKKDPLRDKHIFTLSFGRSLAAERCTVSATPQPRNASTFISGFWRHLPGLPAFHNLSVCELYVLYYQRLDK